jgi:EmrB/QacA subfamily drug resistance transporter
MQLTRLHKWLILLNVSVSIFMATLDGSIVNIALPVISKELSVNISSIQWVVTSYLLAISVLLLVWGKVADLYGKKKIYAFGFIIFTIGSALCGFSKNLEFLVIFRVIQAVGASSMMALSQGIVTSTFPPNERGKALGITGTTVAIGSLVGPSLGGVLVHAAGWKSIFFINVPIGIIGTILTFAIIPEMHEAPDSKEFDYKGTGLFILSVLLLFLGLLFLQEGSIPITIFTPMFLLSLVIMFLFIHYERKFSNPLVNLSLFKIRVFSMGISSAFLSFVALNATILFIPFYLQYALNLNTLSAGLLLSAYPAATAIIAPLSGWLSDKISYKSLTIAGMTMNTLVLFKLATLSTTSSHYEIVLLMCFLGIGSATFQSPNNSSIMGSVPRNQLGVAGGINALFRNLGLVSGTTLSVLIFSFVTKMNINNMSGQNSTFKPELFLHGFRIVLIFAALSCLLAAVISLTRVVNKNNKDGDKHQIPVQELGGK